MRRLIFPVVVTLLGVLLSAGCGKKEDAAPAGAPGAPAATSTPQPAVPSHIKDEFKNAPH